MKHQKIEKFFARVGLILTSVIILAVLLETLTRIIFTFVPYREVTEIRDWYHMPRPYVMAVSDAGVPGINDLGYKGDLPPRPKPKDEFRIIVLGGSTVFGWSPEIETAEGFKDIVALSEQYLHELGHTQVQVYNFGVTSTVALQELVRVIVDAVEYEPDLIISYGSGNDFINDLKRIGYPHRFFIYETNPLWNKKHEEYPWLQLTAFGSRFARLFLKDYFADYFLNYRENYYYKDDSNPIFSDQVANYTRAIQKMHIVSKAFGSEFLAVIQPLRIYSQGEGPHHEDHVIDEQQKAIEILESLPEKINVIDLRYNLADQPLECWMDPIHLTFEGEKYIGRALADQIEPYIK